VPISRKETIAEHVDKLKDWWQI